jgi:PAS domain S-box-containing protein
MNAGWKHAIFLGSLLLLLTYLFNESRDPDRVSRLRTHEALRTLELHDTELSRDVLMARSGQLPSYDALMQDRQHLLEDLTNLSQTSAQGSSAALAVMNPHLGALEAAVKAKLASVEHFKSDNALTRASLMYLTYSVATLDEDAKEQRLGLIESAHLQLSLLRFVETLDSDAAQKIKAELDHLSRAANWFMVPILIAHGRLIVDVLPRVDLLLHQIVEAPTTQHAQALESAMLQHAAQVETRAHLFRYAVYFFSLILFAYLTHVFVRLRSTAKSLSASNTSLQLEMAERAQAEIALRASEQRYRAITQFANEAIISIDSQDNIVSWNVGAQTIFGYRERDVLNKPLRRLIPQKLQSSQEPGFLPWCEGFASKSPTASFESTGIRSDGVEFALEISRSSWKTPQGSFQSGIVRDITERKKLEETTRQQELQLIQANKMTALGTLVSGVAHEIDNPNQSIMLNAPILSASWSDAIGPLDEHVRQDGSFSLGGLPYEEMRNTLPLLTNDIYDCSQEIRRIVNDLKDFARPKVQNLQARFQLNDAVQRAVRLLHFGINERTTHFRLDLTEDLPETRGDAAQIAQVFVNLLTNALEALADKSHAVTVSTAFDSARRQVLLIVQDEGRGIESEHISRICEPFFTTRQNNGGTGLGLAISAALIRAHGGQLSFVSEPGVGTRATVALPCFDNVDAV